LPSGERLHSSCPGSSPRIVFGTQEFFVCTVDTALDLVLERVRDFHLSTAGFSVGILRDSLSPNFSPAP